MEYEEMENNWRVFMLPGEVQQLLDSTKESCERRTRVMIRLMCLSLRIGTAVEVKAGDFFKQDGLWWIKVEGKSPANQYQETKSRKVWIPEPIKQKIDSYIEDEGLSDQDYLADIEKRQLTNDINTAAENAAIATGNEDYKKVTGHDFRRYFATHFIMRLEVSEELVRQLGGWKEISHMWEYLLLPTDLMKRRLVDGGLLGSNPLLMTGRGELEMVEQSFDTIDALTQETDDDDVKVAVKNRIKGLAEKVDDITVTITDVDSSDGKQSTDDTQNDQSSLNAFGDDYNVYGPVAALATGYWNIIASVVDWTVPRAHSMWSQYVDFNCQGWLQKGTGRRVFVFTLYTLLAIGTLAFSMIQIGVYIDPSTWTIVASQNGLLALLTSAAMYMGISGNMWEKVLADFTGQERLVELLTFRLDGNTR